MCCGFLMSYGQNYIVQGIVQDSTDQPLIGGTVVVINPTDSVMLGFSVTDGDGAFKIGSIKKGEYNLQITYIGYGTFQNALKVEGDNKTIDMGIIKLANEGTQLDAVEITGKFIPLVIKKDTVEYNADAYRVRPNASVEDLLKKLPGIEVDKDGKITAEGEDVNKVTVDGKNFFGTDPKAATKNLPADAIKKVQVIDEKSKAAQFSGVEDGNTSKTINLELKEDKKKGFFGMLEGAYGSSERTSNKLSLNTFRKKLQFSVLAGFNNINNNGFSFNDYQTLSGGSGGFRIGRGGSIRMNGPAGIGGGSGNGDSENFNGGANLAYDFSKKAKVSASYYMVNTDNNVYTGSYTENVLSQKAFINQDTSFSNSSNISHSINTTGEWQLDSLQRIDVSANLRFSGNDRINNTVEDVFRLNQEVVNSTDTRQKSLGNSYNLSANLDYNLRLGKAGRVFSIDASMGETENTDSLDILQYGLDANQIQALQLAQYQLDTTSNDNYRVRLNYKEPLGNNQFLDLSASRRNSNSYRLRDFIDQDSLVRNRALASATDNINSVDEYQASYSWNNESTWLRLGLAYQQNHIGNETFGWNESNALIKNNELSLPTKTYSGFVPSLSLRLFDRRLRFNYRTDINAPSTSDLQTIVNNTNPNNIRIGNPTLKPEYEHQVSIRYNKFDRFTFRSLFSNLSYTYTKDNIIDSIGISERFVQTRKPINGNGQHRLNGWLNLRSPINPLYIKTSVRLSGNYTIRDNYVDGQLDQVKTLGPTMRLEVENLNNEHFTIVAYTSRGINNNYYTENSDRNNQYITQSFGGEFIVEFGKGFTFDTQIDLNQYYSNGELANDYTLWNASLSKSFLDGKINLALKAFDLLDQNKGIVVNQTSTSLSRSTSNTLQRYFMLTGTYKFSSFGGAGPQNTTSIFVH